MDTYIVYKAAKDIILINLRDMFSSEIELENVKKHIENEAIWMAEQIVGRVRNEMKGEYPESSCSCNQSNTVAPW